MEPTIIDRLVDDHGALVSYLRERGEISLVNEVENGFRKTVLLAVSSYFESRVKDSILEFASEVAGGDGPVFQLVRRKAIERQYHTLFQWDKRNANYFFSHFGTAFTEFMKLRIEASRELEAAISGFLELGDLRNRLVHQNFATFEIEKTAGEIVELYRDARVFVEALGGFLREHVSVTAAPAAAADG